MTNPNKNELSSRTNLRNLTSTAKAGLHNAATYPRKRYSLLALLLLGVVLCRSEQLTSQATTLQVRNYRQVSQNEVPCTVLEGGCGYKFSSF